VPSIKTKSHRFDFVAYENQKKKEKKEKERGGKEIRGRRGKGGEWRQAPCLLPHRRSKMDFTRRWCIYLLTRGFGSF
jgi:hypothetical protein